MGFRSESSYVLQRTRFKSPCLGPVQDAMTLRTCNRSGVEMAIWMLSNMIDKTHLRSRTQSNVCQVDVCYGVDPDTSRPLRIDELC